MLRSPLRVLKDLGHEFSGAIWEVVKLPFWLILQGWRRLVEIGMRKLVLLVFAAIIVTIVASATLIKATSQPGFCVSCHVMKPYFDAWQTSKHNFVQCTTCHVPPGIKGTVEHKFQALSMVANYMTGLYKRSKPWAEVDDAACLQCHETRLLKGKENFKGVTFDHEPHLTQKRRDRQLRCTSCHAQIVQGEHITVTETTCFLCHFKPDPLTNQVTDLARCTHCHTPPTGAAAADTAFDHTSVLARGVNCADCHKTDVSGDGFVPIERCNSCHAQVEHLEKYSDRDFVHQMHVTDHKVECTNCHTAIRHGKHIESMESAKEQCSSCHGLPDHAMERVWSGDLPGITPSPSPMAKVGMTCTSCHNEPIHENGKGFGKPTCTPCHTPEYNALWPKWKGPVERALEAVEQKVKALPEPDRSQLLQAIDIYRRGEPLHNPDLVKTLEARANGQVVSTSANVGGCASCHPAALNTSPLYMGRRVNHRAHFAITGSCETCHTGQQTSNHGQMVLTMEQCNQCHHKGAGEKNFSCEKCHATQAGTYVGTAPFMKDVMPAAMHEAGISCADCHVTAGKQVTRAVAPACIGCHDDGYADTLRVWQAQGDSLLRRGLEFAGTLKPGTDAYQQITQFTNHLREDGSRTAHNHDLFERWMERRQVTP